LSQFKKIDNYFYADKSGNIYFCVSDFLRTVKWPDTPTMRRLVIEEVHDMAPWMPIVEEAATGENCTGFCPRDN
jgi:hypothetical protein